MQVLLCGCQIPPFRLRWLQIVWSIGERERATSESQGRRFSITYGMAAPYTPMLASLRLLFETFQQQLSFAFSTRTTSYSLDFTLLSCLSPLILHWRTSHGADLMYGVSCASLFAIQGAVLCCGLSFIIAPNTLQSFFIYTWQLYPFLFALLVGCVK